MPKTVSVSEAKNNLSAMMQWALKNEDAVIVASRGKPKAALLSYAEYEELLEFKEAAQRQAALQRLTEIAERIGAKNQELAPNDAEQLADTITRETIQRIQSPDTYSDSTS